MSGVLAANLDVKAGTKRLLDGISFEISNGSFVAIIGSSGCGKSTLVKTLAGIIQPTGGSVLLGGHEVGALSESLPLAIGYLPQFTAFHSESTVREILMTAARLRLPKSVSSEIREKWLAKVTEIARLTPILDQPYSTLSGGQMRRVALGEELIGDPAFFFLDELTSGLDEYSDREMMLWLRELAHGLGKTVALVTHATYHLYLCDAVIFLHRGRLAYFGPPQQLLEMHSAHSVADVLEAYESGHVAPPEPEAVAITPPEPEALRTAPPPSGFAQFPVLLKRQFSLFWQDKSQIWLQLALALIFPLIVAVFALGGLPQVRNLGLQLSTNIVGALSEQLLYLQESFSTASLVSGLAMFQVVLLTLMGANNGAREIAKERGIIAKELRVGLSPAAYLATKVIQVALLSGIQAIWMAAFVRTVCGFPGSLASQFGILFATTLAMSLTCLTISAASPSPERASLLSIYLVGFQLPLSGAALALPEWLSVICRPFIAAYWGWSGYLKTFDMTRVYDIVRQSTKTFIAPYELAMAVLAAHCLIMLFLAWWFIGRARLGSR
jgi:ABC-type multidrug transport system ATPase subunit